MASLGPVACHGAALVTPHGTKRVLTSEASRMNDDSDPEENKEKGNTEENKENKENKDASGNPFRERTSRILNTLDRAGFGSPTPGWSVKETVERKRVTRSFENLSSEDVFGYKRPAKKPSKFSSDDSVSSVGEAGGLRVGADGSPLVGPASVVEREAGLGRPCSNEDGSGESVLPACAQFPEDEVSEVERMIGMDETLDKEPEEDEDDLVAQGLPKGSLTEPLEMKVPGSPSPKGGMIHKFFDFYFGSFCCSQKDQRADHAAARKRIKEDARATKHAIKRSGARKKAEELFLLNSCFRDKSNFGNDHASSDDETKIQTSEPSQVKSDQYQPIYIQPRAGLKGILKNRISDEKSLMCDPDVLREKKRVRFTIPPGEGAGEKEYKGFSEVDEGIYLAQEMNSCWEMRSKGPGNGTEKPYWLTQCFPSLSSLGMAVKGKATANSRAKAKEVEEEEKESDGEPWKSGKISFLNLRSLDTKGEDHTSFVRMQIYPVEKVDTEKELTERMIAEILAEEIVDVGPQNPPNAEAVDNGKNEIEKAKALELGDLTKLPDLKPEENIVQQEIGGSVQEKEEVMGMTKKTEEGRPKSYVPDHVKHPEKYTKYTLDWSAKEDDKSNLKAFEDSRASIAIPGSSKQYRPNPPIPNDFIESNENQPLKFVRQESKTKDEERGVLTEKESNVVAGNEETSFEKRKAEGREEERKGEDSRGKSEDKVKFVHRRRNSGSSAESIEMDVSKNRDRRKNRCRITLGGAVDWQSMLELELGSVHGSIGSGSESLGSEIKDLNEVDTAGKPLTSLDSGNNRCRGRNYRSRRSNSGDGWD